ncbi:MAG: ABC transporter ATP-binding protein [Actinobacteria bacterium]|nr:MAG: ABC transporter ATP-binding protein [Actinomycetota bacterium]
MHFFTRDGVVRAVDGVSFDLDHGETIGVVGESGSGKSVTALTLMGLVPMPPGRVVGGSATFKGESLLGMPESRLRQIRGNSIAMVFQDPMTSLNPVYRVGQQVAEPLWIHKGLSRADAWKRAAELLDLVGIPNASSRVRDYPHQFSGGMRQRVMIAMALACDPDILIADEPTTALDVTIQAQILELMQDLQDRTDSAIIMITHDLGVVADMADKVLVMYAGRPVEAGTVDEVYGEPLHPYTWGLMDSLPRHDMTEKGRLCPIAGQPPSLVHVPPGCPFHVRCRFARDVCRAEVPPMRAVAGGHSAACHFAGDPGFTRAGDACAGVV